MILLITIIEEICRYRINDWGLHFGYLHNSYWAQLRGAGVLSRRKAKRNQWGSDLFRLFAYIRAVFSQGENAGWPPPRLEGSQLCRKDLRLRNWLQLNQQAALVARCTPTWFIFRQGYFQPESLSISANYRSVGLWKREIHNPSLGGHRTRGLSEQYPWVKSRPTHQKNRRRGLQIQEKREEEICEKWVADTDLCQFQAEWAEGSWSQFRAIQVGDLLWNFLDKYVKLEKICFYLQENARALLWKFYQKAFKHCYPPCRGLLLDYQYSGQHRTGPRW